MQQRKLAAIMFTDIVGYTSLMGESEKKAFETINANREVHQRFTEKYQGKIVKELGDGLLTVFENGTDAVLCAVEIQKEAQEKNISLRIGIHEGEVVFENSDVFGDGVNIASRIQAEAAPGGVCVSDAVYRIIRNKEELRAVSIGIKSLKNVKIPIQLYQLKMSGLNIISHDKTLFRKFFNLLIGVVIGVILSFLFFKLFLGGEKLVIDKTQVIKSTIILPEDYPLEYIGRTPLGIGSQALTLSKDGEDLIYIGSHNGLTQLIHRKIDEFEVNPIEGTVNAFYPFFSPDKKWIGFFVENQMRKVPLSGGSPIVLVEAANPAGACWGDDDFIYYSSEEGLKLYKINSEGEQNELLLESNVFKMTYRNPIFLPNGHILLTQITLSRQRNPGIYDPVNNTFELLPISGFSIAYINDGILIYFVNDNLVMTKYNLSDMSILGKTRRLIIPPVRVEGYGLPQIAISESGTMIFCVGRNIGKGRLTWIYQDGSLENIGYDENLFGTFNLSGDGRSVLIERKAVNWEVRNYDLLQKRSEKLNIEGLSIAPVISKDGKKIAYSLINENYKYLHYIKNIGTQADPIRIEIEESENKISSWSSDERFIVLSDLTVIDLEKDSLIVNPGALGIEWGPEFSNNGKYIAYTSGESGAYQVYIQRFPFDGFKKIVSVEGGSEEPRWAPDDSKLYFRNGQKIMSVNIEYVNELQIGEPEIICETNFINVPGHSYDIHPDGDKFLVLLGDTTHTTNEIHMVQGWFEEIGQKAAD